MGQIKALAVNLKGLIKQQPTFYVGLATCSLVFVIFYIFLSRCNPGGDWQAVLRPSTLSFLAGNNPYTEHRFLSPPWAFVVLIPPALLDPHEGSALFALIGAAGYLLAFYRLKAKPLIIFFLIANPAFFAALFNPNFDWAVALGYTLPPPIGLFFVLAKPQISAPLVFFWFVEAWHSGGYRKVLWFFSPVVIAYGLSIIFFGPWMLHMGEATNSLSNTANVWPWDLMVGLVLLTLSMRHRKNNLALMAGPFFSPYLAPYSWLPASLGLLSDTLAIIAAWAAFWIAWLISIKIFG